MTKHDPFSDETSRTNGSRLSDTDHESTHTAPTPAQSGEEYKVGPGHPPKKNQFPPGRSGNPKGRKRKPPSIAPDLKLALERALSKTVTLKQGEREQIVTMATAGIEQLVAQFAKGDRHARRDLIVLAEKLGVDLVAGQRNAIEALAPNYQSILDDYVRRQYDTMAQHSPVLAPPELLDDDPEEQSRKSS
jgi:hypothetical protein